MSHQVYLAVDLGAESGRIIAGLWDGSHLRLEPVHRFPNEPVSFCPPPEEKSSQAFEANQFGNILSMSRKLAQKALRIVSAFWITKLIG